MRRLVGPLAMMVLLAGCAASPSADPGGTSPSATGPTASAQPSFAKAERLPEGRPFVITDDDLTIHSFHSKPQTNSTSFRMACYPQWGQVEAVKGFYNWVPFDNIIKGQKSYGATRLLYSFCGTPEWAGEKVKDPDAEVLGPGTTAAPRRMSDFANYVRAVVQRYKGVIGTYEVWNEPSSPQFFQGTPAQMAEMTKIVRDVVHQEDPDAIVTMASVQTHRPDYTRSFVKPYLKELKKLDWPFDVYNAHFYPPGKGGPAARRAQIAKFRKTLAQYGAPKDKELWDTEVNYYTELTGGEPDGRITGVRAAAWPVRTYLDGWRLGLPRNYWYFATPTYNDFPGIQTRPGDPATRSLATFAGWVKGTRFNGCETKGPLVRCSFATADGARTIAWAEDPRGNDQKSVTAVLPTKGTVVVCSLPDNACRKTTKVKVDQSPVVVAASP
ncbi:MAG: hypothetical protein U0R64_01210 [Candidatus Nanopelagicales bacterium]